MSFPRHSRYSRPFTAVTFVTAFTRHTIGMRLTEHTISVICRLVRQHFGDKANVYLFGSRVDDTKRGGDNDSYVDIPEKLENKAGAVFRFNAKLQGSLGEQRIDVIVRDGTTRPAPYP